MLHSCQIQKGLKVFLQIGVSVLTIQKNFINARTSYEPKKQGASVLESVPKGMFLLETVLSDLVGMMDPVTICQAFVFFFGPQERYSNDGGVGQRELCGLPQLRAGVVADIQEKP